MSERNHTIFQPRLIGFLCENGAYTFYDVSNPARRKLPANFVGMAVAHLNQVQMNEILKAFLSGADGVLIAGCENCQSHPSWQMHFSQIGLTLADFGIDSQRLRLEWITAAEGKKFLRTVNQMMDNLRRLPPLRLPAELRRNIEYCG
jgi:F420-non-reducing hydrogenase iron-sulfur subunit